MTETNHALTWFVRRHTLEECFWHLADTSGGDDACWPWQGRLSLQGYGRVVKDGVFHAAHRLSLDLHGVEIPDEHQVDHTCHNNDLSCVATDADPCLHRRCVNPRHLEPTTARENVIRSSGTVAGRNARKTHCPHGHPLVSGNLLDTASGYRICLTCKTAQSRAGRHKQRLREMTALSNETRATAGTTAIRVQRP